MNTGLSSGAHLQASSNLSQPLSGSLANSSLCLTYHTSRSLILRCSECVLCRCGIWCHCPSLWIAGWWGVTSGLPRPAHENGFESRERRCEESLSSHPRPLCELPAPRRLSICTVSTKPVPALRSPPRCRPARRGNLCLFAL